MLVGLIDVDGHNFPNLCLMKLSAYHKAQGDGVGWDSQEGPMDGLVYRTKGFRDEDSKDMAPPPP